MTYESFKAKYINKRVDYDKVYGYQCVDLVKQYLHDVFAMRPKAWGNAIDYWYNTNPEILKKFDKLSTSSARKGDIVIFKGVNGNPYGHIGVADSHAGRFTVATLEQNGSTGNGSGVRNDAIRVRSIVKWRIAGVLRPKVAKQASKMPAVGSRIRLSKGVARTTFRAGTTRRAGIIRPTDNTYVYIVRGYDPKYSNRVLINSKSAGGDNVALALYYFSGAKIEGWTSV